MNALDRLYAQVPDIACKGLCHDACTTIPAGPAEIARVRAASDDLPCEHGCTPRAPLYATGGASARW